MQNFDDVHCDYVSTINLGVYKITSSCSNLVEWDNTGITDVGAIAGADANAGGTTIAGADVKVTVNSGVSTSGKGILQGIK